MTLAVLLAPPASGGGGGFHLSTGTLIIIAIVVVLGGLSIWGFRAPDRSPHEEERAERDREE
jgi:hypothetical protein